MFTEPVTTKRVPEDAHSKRDTGSHLVLLLCYSGLHQNLQKERPRNKPMHHQHRGAAEASAGER
jgi:hypothetical protein